MPARSDEVPSGPIGRPPAPARLDPGGLARTCPFRAGRHRLTTGWLAAGSRLTPPPPRS